MSIELSPSQERKLHSILDRGLDTLHDSIENISRSTPSKNNWSSSLENSYPPQRFLKSPQQTEKSHIINLELKTLQEKLATLEAKLSDKIETKPSRSRDKSPAGIPRGNHVVSLKGTNRSRKQYSRERLKMIESTEKEISRIERSITPSPGGAKMNLKKTERRAASSKGKVAEDKITKENEILKKELAKMEELKGSYEKLQDDFTKLQQAYERSERIRIKQKDLINNLKSELKDHAEITLRDKSKQRTKKSR